MDFKNIPITKIAGIAIAIIAGIFIFSSLIGFSNDEVDLRNRFKQKMDERTAFYDKMWKTIAQNGQVTLKADSSFSRNVNAIMAGRKDAQGLFMKWVQESNPNANYDLIAKMYQNLTVVIEGQRDGFFMEEKVIQGIVLEHSNLLQKFPGSFYNVFFGRKLIDYKPITSDRTDDVIKTGKDNNVSVF